MYGITKWLDKVVDAETGELIQQGTDQSAANFNNMENGIHDAHVAAALLQIVVNAMMADVKRIEVVEGTVDATKNKTAPYPEGFTRDNCVVVSVMTTYGKRADGTYNYRNKTHDGDDLHIVLDDDYINVKNEGSVNSYGYKIALCKYK